MEWVGRMGEVVDLLLGGMACFLGRAAASWGVRWKVRVKTRTGVAKEVPVLRTRNDVLKKD